MGQSADCPNIGMEIVEVSFLFCIVLDHLTIMVANFSPKITSPLVRCLVISKL